jgi:Tfp pilus assembly PilM family ATPase
MADILIGLDIDSSVARAVEIVPGNPVRVRRMGQVELPPGAVRDGEVVDAAAVGGALRQLWSDAGFSRRPVHVAIASSRVIVRPVEMPVMADGDTRAALRFQLGDFVPLAPEQTVFDFQQLAPDPARPDEHQVLLAAAPREVVEPLADALKHAGLRIAHIDIAAVALARLGPSTPAIDAVVSIGPDMVVVVATRWGQPIFARALSNLGDRHAEIAAEIGDSLAYFAGQPGGGYPQTIAITGAGNLLEIRERLEQQLAIPVGIIDPFAQLGLADGVVHSHPLVPSLGLALGAALGGGRGRVRSINLLADRSPGGRRALRPLLVGAAALVVLIGAATLVRGQQQDIATARDERDQIEAQLTSAREQAAERAASGATGGGGASSNAALLALARTGDVDWTSVTTQLDTIGEPLGVGITSLRGTASTAAATDPSAATTATPATAVGTVTISGTAADLYAVAAWIDAVVADERFDAAWVDSSNAADGGTLEFSGVVTLNDRGLMDRPHLTGAQS